MNKIGSVVPEIWLTSGYDVINGLTLDVINGLTVMKSKQKPVGPKLESFTTKINEIGQVFPEISATSGYDVINGPTVMKF
jgi:hypothetical protein